MHVFFQPFKWQVWLTIATFIPFVTVMLSAAVRIATKLRGQTWRDSFADNILDVYGQAVNQSETFSSTRSLHSPKENALKENHKSKTLFKKTTAVPFCSLERVAQSKECLTSFTENTACKRDSFSWANKGLTIFRQQCFVPLAVFPCPCSALVLNTVYKRNISCCGLPDPNSDIYGMILTARKPVTYTFLA